MRKFILMLALLVAGPAFADTVCEPTFNGGFRCYENKSQADIQREMQERMDRIREQNQRMIEGIGNRQLQGLGGGLPSMQQSICNLDPNAYGCR